MKRIAVGIVVTILCSAHADTISPLLARGYTVMPQPQIVTLGASDFSFSADWKLEVRGVRSDEPAVQVLQEDLERRYRLKLTQRDRGAGVLRLIVAANSAKLGQAQDKDRA